MIVKASAPVEALRDHRHEGLERFECVCKGRGFAEDRRINAKQQFRVLVGRTPQHDAIDVLQMRTGVIEAGHAAVDDDRPAGMGALQVIDQRVVERRNRAVVLGAQAFEPGFSRVHDQRRRAGRLYRRGEGEQRLARLLLVDSDFGI